MARRALEVERGIDEHEPLDARRRDERRLHRGPSAERMTDQRRALDLQRVKIADDAPALRVVAVVRVIGPRGEAERRHVERDGAVAASGERLHRLAPDLAPCAGPVDEQNRRAGERTLLLHVELDVGGPDEPARRRGRVAPGVRLATGSGGTKADEGDEECDQEHADEAGGPSDEGSDERSELEESDRGPDAT